MASWTDYKGVTVADIPTGQGGKNLTDNFKFLADAVIPATFNARLTLDADLKKAVTTADTTSTTLYLTPFRGERIALYDPGTATWTFFDLAQISSSSTSLITGRTYDVFVYDNAGLTLELVDWTGGRTTPVLQDGVYVKSGATARRYVGTVHTITESSTIKFVDTKSQRLVWNYYNRVPRSLIAQILDDTWTYNVTAYRVSTGIATLGQTQVKIVIGMDENPVEIFALNLIQCDTAHRGLSGGVGIDSTTANSAIVHGAASMVANLGLLPLPSRYVGYPGIGMHDIYHLEGGNSVAITTWMGVWNFPLYYQAGMCGLVMA